MPAYNRLAELMALADDYAKEPTPAARAALERAIEATLPEQYPFPTTREYIGGLVTELVHGHDNIWFADGNSVHTVGGSIRAAATRYLARTPRPDGSPLDPAEVVPAHPPAEQCPSASTVRRRRGDADGARIPSR